MKDIVRTLDFYEFDGDNTMYDINSYTISKVVEVKDNKYIKQIEESGDTSDDDSTEGDNSTSLSGGTSTSNENNG